MTAEWYIWPARNRSNQASRDKVPAGAIGPISTENMLELHSLGELAEGDLVLMAGTDMQMSVAQFLAMARNGSLPGMERTASVPPGIPTAPPQPNRIPEWLADVAQANASRPSKVPEPQGWLEDIRQIEESLRQPQRPQADAPLTAKPTTAPVPLALPVTPMPPRVSPPSAPGEERGYDAETGQIRDPVAYRRWQREEAERRQEALRKQPRFSVAEVFLKALRDIQEWVDAEANKPLVVSGNEARIRKCASVQELMRRYELFGKVMQEKLWQRLFFLVENRKKFYLATR